MIWMVPILEAITTVLTTVVLKAVQDWQKKEEASESKLPPCIEPNKKKSTQKRKRRS